MKQCISIFRQLHSGDAEVVGGASTDQEDRVDLLQKLHLLDLHLVISSLIEETSYAQNSYRDPELLK